MKPPSMPLRWSRPQCPARPEVAAATAEPPREHAPIDRQPYAELAPLLGWDQIPELMRVLDE